MVAWNSGAHLERVLSSLCADERRARLDIVVVDNGSVDGAVDRVVKTKPGIRVVRFAENRGFAAACNAAVRSLDDVKYILFLNPDTLVSGETVLRAVGLLDTPPHQRTGICGIALIDRHGSVRASAAHEPTLSAYVSYIFGLDRLTFPWIARLHYLSKELDRSRVVDHVCGAFFLVRADLFDQLHGFDERFFLYFEDVDFSMRARKAGWHSWFAADLHGYHEGGASSRAIPAQRLFYSTRSRILLFAKHRTRSARFIHMLLTVTVEPLTRTAFCLGRRDIGGIRDVYWAFSRLYLWLLSRRWTGPRAAPVGPPD